MAIENNPLSIERRRFDKFMRDFKSGKYGTQRLGQAFYNEMNLHRIANQDQTHNIWAKDGQQAVACIKANWIFT